MKTEKIIIVVLLAVALLGVGFLIGGNTHTDKEKPKNNNLKINIPGIEIERERPNNIKIRAPFVRIEVPETPSK